MGVQRRELGVWVELVADGFLVGKAVSGFLEAGDIRCFECREFVALAITALQGRLSRLRGRRWGILCCVLPVEDEGADSSAFCLSCGPEVAARVDLCL